MSSHYSSIIHASATNKKLHFFLNPQTSFSLPTWGLVDYVAVKLIILSKVLDESWETLRHDKLICQTESGRATWSYNTRKIGPLSCFLLSLHKIQQKDPSWWRAPLKCIEFITRFSLHFWYMKKFDIRLRNKIPKKEVL